jgi:polysaccharide export outer membrane protein
MSLIRRSRMTRNLPLLALIFASLTGAGSACLAADEPKAAGNEAPPLAAVSPQYIIGPGDTLQVYVWRNPELSVTVPVRPDGKVSSPLVENMVAVGKTPSELARDMEQVLSEFVRTPKVNIIVTQSVSTFSQVRVVGQVVRPQAVAFREGITVLDVVLQVGGLGPFAAGNRAKIVRPEGGKTIEIGVKLNRLLNGGDMRQNVVMKPGDVLVVPEALF